MNTAFSAHFDQQYQLHLKHLKLKGLQPKTIDAGSPFDAGVECISEQVGLVRCIGATHCLLSAHS